MESPIYGEACSACNVSLDWHQAPVVRLKRDDGYDAGVPNVGFILVTLKC